MDENFDKLVQRLEKFKKAVDDLNGKVVDLDHQKFVLKGPFLHTNTENATEKESAAFERNHKKLFDYLRHIRDELNKTLTG